MPRFARSRAAAFESMHGPARCRGTLLLSSSPCHRDPRLSKSSRLAPNEGVNMTTTDHQVRAEGTNRVIDSIREAEESALEAVRKFVDTVNGVFPDGDDGPRRKI